MAGLWLYISEAKIRQRHTGHQRNSHGADGEMWRLRGERSEITDVVKVMQAILYVAAAAA